VDEVEQADRDNAELGDLEEDPKVLTLGGLRARSVRSESNPVGY
jgi:hypothetical protein